MIARRPVSRGMITQVDGLAWRALKGRVPR
jgi:hypothetical protein